MRHVHFARRKLPEPLHRKLRGGIRRRGYRKRYKRLVEVKRGVPAFEDVVLHMRNRLEDRRRKKRKSVGYAGKLLDGIKYDGRTRMEFVGVATGYDFAIVKLKRCGGDDRAARLALALQSSRFGGAACRERDKPVLGLESKGVHQHLRAANALASTPPAQPRRRLCRSLCG